MPRSQGVEWLDGAIGRRIQRLRKAHGMSVQATAQGIVTHQHLNKIERGEHQPTHETLEKLAKRLRTSVDYLANGPKPPSGFHDRAIWILKVFGSGSSEELRELFKEQPPSFGRDRMIWLLQKLKTSGPVKLAKLAEELEEIKVRRAWP